MALNVTNINYVGRDSDIYIRTVFEQNTLIDVAGFRFVEGIKSKYVWHDLFPSIVIECDIPTCPTLPSDFTLNQNEGEVCSYHTSGEIAHQALVATFRERFLRDGVHFENTLQDPQFQQAFMAMIMDKLRREYGLELMRGGIYSPCDCDGLIEKILDNTRSRPVPAGQILTATPVTALNVQDEMWTVFNAMPEQYKDGGGQFSEPVLYVSPTVFYAYKQSLTHTSPVAATGLGVLDPNVSIAPWGQKVIKLSELRNSEMLLTSPDNIVIFADLVDDVNRISIVDLLPTQNCLKFNWRVDWRGGIEFGDGDAIVWYA